jgi:GTP-binding protein
MGIIEASQCAEVAHKWIRLRKRFLKEHERKKASREGA